MSLTLVGYAKAHIPAGGKDGKSLYIRVGSMFTDDFGRYVLKIDVLPLPGQNWSGWINVFPPGLTDAAAARKSSPTDIDDYIPF